jgi:phage shock protein A
VTVWSRVVRIFKARVRRKRQQDPIIILQRELQLMDEKVLRVKRSSLALGKSKIQLEHRIRDLGKKTEDYQREARKALRLGREDLAKLALKSKQTTVSTQELLRSKVEMLEHRIAESERLKEELASKIMIYKIKRDEIELTRSAAKAELSTEELKLGLSMEDPFFDSQEAFKRLEDEVEELNAQVEATRELNEARPLSLSIDDDKPLPSEVAAELEMLKRELRENNQQT